MRNYFGQEIKYARGEYNKFDDNEQWIRISEGCPNNCGFCYETKICGREPIYLPIPEIVRNKVKIMDMNLIYKPKALEIIKDLGSRKVGGKVVYYEFICGVDWRFLTDEIAIALKESRFQNIRLAWDGKIIQQYKIKDAIDKLLKAGYKSKEISIFMVCNWEIPYEERLQQMDLCKIWRVKINDCWFDNQLSPNIIPIHWTAEQIKDFRHKCRKHNQMVLFGIDPEVKKYNP
jgi:hypothetical protein